ncbi:MAG: FtsX-like permease family protein [Myxococcota bacterium]
MQVYTLLRHDLSRSRGRFAGVGVAVAASVAVVMVLASVGLALYQQVLLPLLPRLPLSLVKVEPRTVNLGLIAFNATELTGGLDERTIVKLGALDGVTEVFPIVGTAFPLRAAGGEGFIGRRIRTDVFATGLAEGLVKDDVADGYRFVDRPDGKVPVIVARRLLDLYNTTVAPAIQKPQLSPDAVIGFEFELVVGTSLAKGTPDPSKVRIHEAEIVGLSDQANLVGITVPEPTLRRWNRDFGHAPPLTGAYIRTRSPRDVGAVAQQVERMGLRVDETPKLIGAALAIVGALFGLFTAILVTLAAFGIAQTFFRLVSERRLEFAIFRALGARRRDLRRLILLEAGIVGLAGGLTGTALGLGTAVALGRWTVAALPDLPFTPQGLAATPPMLMLAGILLGVVASVLGAWWPAVRAGAADPAVALRQ